MDLEKMANEDWIKNIYYGEGSLAKKMPSSKEYNKLTNVLNSIYTLLLQ